MHLIVIFEVFTVEIKKCVMDKWAISLVKYAYKYYVKASKPVQI